MKVRKKKKGNSSFIIRNQIRHTSNFSVSLFSF